MSCLQNCKKKEYYHINCNFDYNGYQYENSIDTCQRDNLDVIFPENCDICKTVVDCCADNINNCCKRSSTSLPSSYPTSQPTILCNTGEPRYLQKSEMCGFLEIRNKDITKKFDDSMMCCSEKRNECCIIKSNEIFIGFGCFVLFILLCVYFHLRTPNSSIHIQPNVSILNNKSCVKITPVQFNSV